MAKCSKTDLTTGFQPEDDELSIRFRAADGTWQFGTKIIKDGVVTFESPVGTVIAAPDAYEYNDPECPGAKTVSICGPVEVFTAGGFSGGGGGGGVDTVTAIEANTAAVELTQGKNCDNEDVQIVEDKCLNAKMTALQATASSMAASLVTIATNTAPVPTPQLVAEDGAAFYTIVLTNADGTFTEVVTDIAVPPAGGTVVDRVVVDKEPLCVEGFINWNTTVFNADGTEASSVMVATTDKCDECCPIKVDKTLVDCRGKAITIRYWVKVANDGTETYLNGTVTGSTMVTHAVGDTVADINAAPFDAYFDPSLYPSGTPSVADDEMVNGFIGIAETINVLANDTGVTSVSLVAGSEVNASVVDNGDGTFSVTASDCVGEFLYETVSGCQARVYWDWTNRPTQSFSLSVGSETDFTFQFIQTSDGSGLQVDWGDGNVSTVASNVALTHPYSTAYTGDITVSYSGCASIVRLAAAQNQIVDMSAVANLTNLTYLHLYSNQIVDMSAVAGLTDLTYLHLGNNQIVDMSAVAGLTTLTYLNLANNQIVDMSAVAGLTDLTYLSLANHQIVDMSAVAGLTDLTYLHLGNNQIVDMSAVANLTNLTYLHLYSNQIVDMSAVAGLTNLTYLYLYSNQIVDMSAVAGLTDLTYLNLANNQIVDMRAVAGLTDLTYLHLYSNLPTVADVNIAICLAAAYMTSGTFQIHGTNPAPDTTSGGQNGVACAAAMTAAGVSVTTS